MFSEQTLVARSKLGLRDCEGVTQVQHACKPTRSTTKQKHYMTQWRSITIHVRVRESDEVMFLLRLIGACCWSVHLEQLGLRPLLLHFHLNITQVIAPLGFRLLRKRYACRTATKELRHGYWTYLWFSSRHDGKVFWKKCQGGAGVASEGRSRNKRPKASSHTTPDTVVPPETDENKIPRKAAERLIQGTSNCLEQS